VTVQTDGTIFVDFCLIVCYTNYIYYKCIYNSLREVNIKYRLHIKPIILLFAVGIFLFDSIGYSLPDNLPKTNLRKPLDFCKGKKPSSRYQTITKLASGQNIKPHVFIGPLAPFTKMTEDKFIKIYSRWLKKHYGRRLTPVEIADIKRFAALLKSSGNIGWRKVEDAVDNASTIGDLYEELKKDEYFPGVCDFAAPGVFRILKENSFSAKLIRRRDSNNESANYVEVEVAGEWLIIDPTADTLELEYSRVYSLEDILNFRSSMTYGYKEIAGLVVAPKKVIKEQRISMYTKARIVSTEVNIPRRASASSL